MSEPREITEQAQRVVGPPGGRDDDRRGLDALRSQGGGVLAGFAVRNLPERGWRRVALAAGSERFALALVDLGYDVKPAGDLAPGERCDALVDMAAGGPGGGPEAVAALRVGGLLVTPAGIWPRPAFPRLSAILGLKAPQPAQNSS